MRDAIIVTMAASWCLVGLSITVALVIYPSFFVVGPATWPAFHRQHSSRITWAVGPPWLLQAIGLGLWLLAGPRSTWWAWILCSTAAILAVVVTIVSAVPTHERLSAEFSHSLGRRLLVAHWVRTITWLIAALAPSLALAQLR
jgi:hypothetical protein